jgi:peptide/nickel transport system permease protein
MRRYVLQRLVLVIPTLLGVTIAISLLVRFIPGGAASAFCSEGCTKEQTVAIEKSLGLDRPWPVQYVEWLGNALTGDLGEGFQNRRSVADDIRTRLPVTLQLGLMAMIVGLLISLPVGIISAIRQDTLIDYVARSSAVAWLSVPSFWIGTLIIAWGGKLWNWAPPLTYESFL